MIKATVLLGAFYGNHIADGLDNAYHLLVTVAVSADVTKFFIRNVMTACAKQYLFPHLRNGCAEVVHCSKIFLYEMQHQPQCGLFPNPRKGGKFINGIFKK